MVKYNMVKKIILYNNKGIVLVDDIDYERLNKYTWSLHKSCVQTCTKVDGKWIIRKIHHCILNKVSGLEIDHIDRNYLNNQRSNLRLVTPSQNAINKAKVSGTSRFKGVCWDKSRNKWMSYIKKDKKRIHIGRFINEIDAALSYNEMALKLFGEYAYLNKID